MKIHIITVFGLVLLFSSSQAAIINVNEFNKAKHPSGIYIAANNQSKKSEKIICIDIGDMHPLTPEEMIKKAKAAWVNIENTYSGIDKDLGYYPALWYMKSKDVDVLFSKELGDNPDKDLKIIKMQDSDPVETVELHFFHEYFYKAVTKYRVGNNEQINDEIKKVRDKYGPSDQEIELGKNGLNPSAKSSDKPEIKLEEIITWTGNYNKGTLIIRRDNQNSIKEVILTKEHPKLFKEVLEKLEEDKKNQERDEAPYYK